MRQNKKTGSIILDHFTEYMQTTIPKGNEVYYLYGIEDINSSPSEEYAIIKSRNGGSRKLLDIGHMEIKPDTPSKEKINTQLEKMGEETLSEDELEIILDEYTKMSREIIRDRLYRGSLQLYTNIVFADIKDMGKAMMNRLDQLSSSVSFEDEYKKQIGRAIERSIDWEGTQVPVRNETQFNSFKVTSEDISTVPFIEHCQFKAKLQFDEYPDWKLTAIEYKHYSIINSQDLAKTKALLDHDYSRSEISEILSVSSEKVTQYCQELENIYLKLQWTEDNIDF